MTIQEAIDYIEQDIMQCVMCGEWEEALKIAVEALEKQIPEPVRKSEYTRTGMGAEFHDYVCPSCGRFLEPEPKGNSIIEEYEGKLSRCARCGQVILWKKVDE